MDLYPIGKLNISLLRPHFGQIQTDEVIVSNERIEHIKSHHPEDYDLFLQYGQATVESPDYLIQDTANTGTVFAVKKLPDTNLNIIVRLVLEDDDPTYKNSVMTFYRLRERNLEKLIKKHHLLYKRE